MNKLLVEQNRDLRSTVQSLNQRNPYSRSEPPWKGVPAPKTVPALDIDRFAEWKTLFTQTVIGAGLMGAFEENLESWKDLSTRQQEQGRSMAMQLLTDSLGQSNKSFILEAKGRPEHVMESLERTYGTTTAQDRLILEAKWSKFHWNQGWSVNKFFEELKVLVSLFTAMKRPKTKDQVFEKILSIIPQKYEIPKSIMMAWAEPDVAKCRKFLLSSENDAKQRTSTGPTLQPKQGEIYKIKGKEYQLQPKEKTTWKKKKKEKKKNKRTQPTEPKGCHYCGVEGHKRPNCRSKVEDEKKGIKILHRKGAKLPSWWDHKNCHKTFCHLAGKGPKREKGSSNVSRGKEEKEEEEEISSDEEPEVPQPKKKKEKKKVAFATDNLLKGGANPSAQPASSSLRPGSGYYFSIFDGEQSESLPPSPTLLPRERSGEKRKRVMVEDDSPFLPNTSDPKLGGEKKRRKEQKPQTSTVQSVTFRPNQSVSFVPDPEGSPKAHSLFEEKPESTDVFVEDVHFVASKNTQGTFMQTDNDEWATFFGEWDTDPDETVWILDGGATHHITCERDCVSNTHECNLHVKVGKAGTSFTAHEVGQTTFTAVDSEKECTEPLHLESVYYSPDGRPNVISETQLIKKGAKVVAEGTNRLVYFNGNPVLRAVLSKDLWVVVSHVPTRHSKDNVSRSSLTISDDETRSVHRTLAHLNTDAINKMIDEKMVDGLPTKHLSSCLRNRDCPLCVAGKGTSLPWDKGDKYDEKVETSSLEVLDEIHSDSSGRIKPPSRYKNEYMFLYIDAGSCFCFCFGVQHLDKQNECYYVLQELWETQLGKRAKLFICDGHGCYDNKIMRAYLKTKGTNLKIRLPRQPRQNPIAERRMRTLFEMARTLMLQAATPEDTWEDAFIFANFIRNRVYTRSLAGMVPHTKFWRKKPDLSRVHPWGCLVYVIVHKLDRDGKWAPNAIPSALMGITTDYSGYKAEALGSRELIMGRDCVFYDNVFPYRNEPSDDLLRLNPFSLVPSAQNPLGEQIKNLVNPDYMVPTSAGKVHIIPPPDPPETRASKRARLSSSYPAPETLHPLSESSSRPLSQSPPSSSLERGGETPSFTPSGRGDEKSWDSLLDSGTEDENQRVRSAMETDAEWFFAEIYAAEANPKAPEVPSGMDEALSGPFGNEWEAAYKREWEGFQRTGTLARCTPEVHAKIKAGKIRVHEMRTILSLKLNAEGVVERHKVRTVVRGFTMQQGIDYYYTHSPTARHSTVRLTISQGVLNGWEVIHYDIPNAYLNGMQETLVVVRIPEGWNRIMGDSLGKDGDPAIMVRSIYGAPNAGRTWNCALHTFFHDNGYTRAPMEPCLYVKWTRRAGILLVSTYTVYVDDLLESGNDNVERARMREQLEKKYLAKCLGRVSFIIGIACTWDSSGGCKMTQTSFIDRILDKYKVEKCKRRYTPADRKPDDSMCPTSPQELQTVENFGYRQLVGAQLYLVVCTRPDISYIVCALARYNHKPGMQHWKMLITVLKYLRHTREMGLYYHPDPNLSKDKNGLVDTLPDVWTDSSYVDGDKGRTTLGELLYNGPHLIHWRSHLSTVVPHSTCEAEILAACSGSKEQQWFIQVKECVFQQLLENKPRLLIDCKPAIDSIVSAKVPKKLRHMKAKFYYVRDLYEAGEIEPIKVDKDEQRADAQTKPQPNPLFSTMRGWLNIE
jgi:hypothetical protein